MRKIFLILISFFTSYLTQGQIFTESFENLWAGSPAAPNGWTQVAGQTGSGAGTDIAWEQSTWSSSTGWTPSGLMLNLNGADDGSSVAKYSNKFSQTGQTDSLITPTIDLSSTINPYVSFSFNYYSGNAVLQVLASSDGITNWTDITNGGVVVNGQGWCKYTFNLAPFKTSSMKIAFVVLAENNTYDFWLDNIVVDDSQLPLNGVYTIDMLQPTSGTNFGSFTDAVNALNRSGISGPVTFNVYANETFIEEIPVIHATGTATNPIIFQKDGIGINPVLYSTGVMITTEAGFYVKGGDYFTFDGIDIRAINSNLDFGFYFSNSNPTNGAKNITLKNCKIKMSKPGGMGALSASGSGTPITTGGVNSNIIYQNLIVEDAKSGLGIYATSNFPSEGCIIEGCTVGADVANDIGSTIFNVCGIITTYCKNIVITNNHVRNLFGEGNYTAGIYVIHIGTNSLISNNLIHSIKVTSVTSADQAMGIASAGYSLLDTMTISNNIIYDLSHNIVNPSTSTSIKVINLNSVSVGANKVYFNSVYFNAGSIAGSAAVYNYGGPNEIKNNILYNASPGGATSKRYLIRHTGTACTSNNNILLNVAGTNNFIGYNGGDKTTLADWQASSGTPDLNSYSIDPIFVSNTDLHFTNKAMNNLGVPIAGITTDYDGEVRNITTPDIGADEYDDFTPPSSIYTPADASIDVPVNSEITIVYSENIRMIDNSAITNLNVTSLITFQDASLNNIPFTATWNSVENKITIIPSSVLAWHTQYTVSVAAIEDSWDNSDGGSSSTFTTEYAVPAISIALTTGSNPSCENSELTFTATYSNGGSNPSFKWMINGNIAGTNSDFFTSSTILNNDTITCELTSDDPDANPLTALSDSIIMVINNITYGDTAAVSCDSFDWYGTNYTASVTATHTFTNVAGCDSIVTLNLTINNSNTGDTTAVACDSFDWYGTTYTASGTPTHTFTNAAGCDSVVTLNLTINNSNTGIDVQTACYSYTWIDGNTYTSSTSAPTFTLTNQNGCDSVVTLDLTINYSNTGTDAITACDSYTWIDGVTYTSSTNTPTFTLTNIYGCDSIVTLDLTINNSNTGTDVQTACDSYTWIDGITYTSGTNTPTFTLTNAVGCDSVVTLNLTINNSNTGDTSAVACDSFDWYGTTYTSSTTDTHTFINELGCDSVVTLNLTIVNSNTGTDVQSACESYTWIDGITYTSDNNTATITLTNSAGCDSVVTLDLTINHATAGTDVITACDSYTWIDGITYTSSTNTPTFTLTDSNGCDSVVTLDLTINPNIVVNLGNDQVLCYEIMQIKTLDAGNPGMSYLWSNGSTSQTYVADALVLGMGSHTIGVTVTDGVCTSTDEIVLTVDICSGITSVNKQLNISMYPNPTKGVLNIAIEGLNSEATLSIMDVSGRTIINETLSSETTQKQVDFSNLPKGIYAVKVTSGDFVKVTRIVVQ